MDAEGLMFLVAMVLHWRITLCIAMSVALAVALAIYVPWISGLQAIPIALIGFIPGAIWEDRSALPPNAKVQPARQTSLPTLVTAAALAGLAWGLFSGVSLHSFVAGAILFPLFAIGWAWYAVRLKSSISKPHAYICILSAAVAYPVGALLLRYAL
jgi:hypothetical protein